MEIKNKYREFIKLSKDICLKSHSGTNVQNEFLKYMGGYVFRDISYFAFFLIHLKSFEPINTETGNREDDDNKIRRFCKIELDNGLIIEVESYFNLMQSNAYSYSCENNPYTSFTPKKQDAGSCLTFYIKNPKLNPDECEKIITFFVNPMPYYIKKEQDNFKTNNIPEYVIVVSTFSKNGNPLFEYYLNNEHVGFAISENIVPKKRLFFKKKKLSNFYRNLVVTKGELTNQGQDFCLSDNDYYEVMFDINLENIEFLEPLMLLTAMMENNYKNNAFYDFANINFDKIKFTKITAPEFKENLHVFYKDKYKKLTGFLAEPDEKYGALHTFHFEECTNIGGAQNDDRQKKFIIEKI